MCDKCDEQVHINSLNDVIRKVKQLAKEAKQYKDMYDVPIEPKRVSFYIKNAYIIYYLIWKTQNILQKYICKMV